MNRRRYYKDKDNDNDDDDDDDHGGDANWNDYDKYL